MNLSKKERERMRKNAWERSRGVLLSNVDLCLDDLGTQGAEIEKLEKRVSRLDLRALFAYLNAKGSVQSILQDAAHEANCPKSTPEEVEIARNEIVDVLTPLVGQPWDFAGTECERTLGGGAEGTQ